MQPSHEVKNDSPKTQQQPAARSRWAAWSAFWKQFQTALWRSFAMYVA